MNKKEMNNKGFSLVELIIVIAIMAILVGVLAPQFIKYVERSRISTDMQNVEQLKTAIEVYIADPSNTQPTSDVTITFTGGAGGKAVVTNLPSGADLSGAPTTVNFKSSGWTAGTAAVYDNATTKTYKWTGGSCTNGTYNMNTIFGTATATP